MKNITMLPVENLFPHPDNPRKNLGDLTELSESIKTKGIMQNLTVVAKDDGVNYTVIIGHRRLGAAKEAGLTALPCAIVEMSPTDQVATMLLENVQRAELTPFEQMKGFQMLLDLGETVETISQKTGFSQSTVRRRIKLTELDEKKLADAMSRQVTLSDLAKLEEIKNKKARNECLAAAGTSNFEARVRNALSEQKSKENKKKMLAELDKYAKEVKKTTGYSYEGYYSFYNYTPGQFDKLAKGKKEEYVYDLCPSGIYLYKKAERKESKKSKAQLEREKDIRTRESQLKDASEKAKELRKLFYLEYVPPAGKNAELYEKCVDMIIHGTRHYTSCYTRDLMRFYQKEYNPANEEADINAFIGEGHLRALIRFVFCSYDDSPGSFYQTRYEDYPTHKPNSKLVALYEFLEFLGYGTSDEEKSLIEGTHAAFKK